MPENTVQHTNIVVPLTTAYPTGDAKVELRLICRTEGPDQFSHDIFRLRPADAIELGQKLISAGLNEIRSTITQGSRETS